MKKTLLFIVGALMSLTALAQDYVFVVWSDTAQLEQSGYEAQMLAAIEALPQVDYLEYINDVDTWVAFLEDASNFDDYDGVIICESGSSSKAQGYGALGYPKPTILMEPYVLHKSGWEWYASGMLELHKDFGFTAERFVEVIEAADHPIFTGFGVNAGDEVTFAEGPVDGNAGSYALPIDMAISDISDAATPLAKNKHAVVNSTESVYNMWAIEENAITPRIFLWGYHAADLETQYDELGMLMGNAALWVLGEEIIAGVEDKAAATVSVSVSESDVLTVSGVEVAQISVYSLTGASVLSVNGTSSVSVAGLTDGIYMVAVVDANGAVTTTKIVK